MPILDLDGGFCMVISEVVGGEGFEPLPENFINHAETGCFNGAYTN